MKWGLFILAGCGKYTSHIVRWKPPDCSFIEHIISNIVYDPSKIIQGYFYIQLKLAIVFQYKQNLPMIFTWSRKAQNASVTNIKCLTLFWGQG